MFLIFVYRNPPKVSPGLILVQRPFSGGAIIFGGGGLLSGGGSGLISFIKSELKKGLW